MRKLLLLPVALFFSCKQAADNAVSGPPTDHSITLVEEEPKESIEDKVYVTYEADTTGLSAEPTTPLKLLLEGSFHKGEVWQHAEKKPWLAVFYENGSYYLRKASIQINPAYDPVVDSDEVVNGKRVISGREVVSQDSNAVFFLTGLKNYKAGAIDTVTLTRNVLPANKSLSYTFKGKSYNIKAFGDSIKLNEQEYAYRNYGWKVSGTKKGKYVEQLLAQDEYFEDSIYTLLWAGDLDRDGTPDLLIDVSNHYNVSSIVLFLSSFAEKDQLYQKVAVFETVGC